MRTRTSGGVAGDGRATPGRPYADHGLHWTLDVAFREDHSRIRSENGAQNFALLRRITFNALRREKTEKGGLRASGVSSATPCHPFRPTSGLMLPILPRKSTHRPQRVGRPTPRVAELPPEATFLEGRPPPLWQPLPLLDARSDAGGHLNCLPPPSRLVLDELYVEAYDYPGLSFPAHLPEPSGFDLVGASLDYQFAAYLCVWTKSNLPGIFYRTNDDDPGRSLFSHLAEVRWQCAGACTIDLRTARVTPVGVPAVRLLRADPIRVTALTSTLPTPMPETRGPDPLAMFVYHVHR